MTAKRNDGHNHLAGPPEGRAGTTARDDTARDDTDVTTVRARTSSTHAPQRRVAGPTRPNRARGSSGARCRAGVRQACARQAYNRGANPGALSVR